MTGKEYLDYLCGTADQPNSLTERNVNDTEYRAWMLANLNLVGKNIQARQRAWHWRWLEKTATMQTVADQIDYDLPSDIDERKIYGVLDRTDNIAYKYIEHYLFERDIPNPSEQSGDSKLYTVWAGNLKLWPVPSDTRTIYLKYIQKVGELADNTDVWTVPDKYDPVVINGALSFAYQFDPQLGDYKTKVAEFEAGIEGMISENAVVIDDMPVVGSHRNRWFRQYPYANEYPLSL